MKSPNTTQLAVISLLMFLAPAMGQQNPLDHWITRDSSTSGHLLDVAYGHGTYIAVGGLPPFNPSDPIQPSLLASVDGTAWTPLVLPTNANFFGVSFVNNQFIAVGDSGLIITSPDGASWELKNSSAPNRTADIYPLGGVAHGGGRYVAMNRLLGNYCLVSTNAADWTAVQLQPGASYAEMDRVRFAQGIFVAGGILNNAVVLTSTNGINWVQHPSPLPGSSINDLAYGDGKWVGVGDLGAVITSANGATWTKAMLPPAVATNQVNLHGIIYANGFFTAVGDPNTIMTSADGLNWKVRTGIHSGALNAVAFGGGYYVAVGLAGVALQSGPVLSLTMSLQPDGAALTISAPPGIRAVVQDSQDLAHWSNLFSIPSTTETQTLVDTNTSSAAQRFYQAFAP